MHSMRNGKNDGEYSFNGTRSQKDNKNKIEGV